MKRLASTIGGYFQVEAFSLASFSDELCGEHLTVRHQCYVRRTRHRKHQFRLCGVSLTKALQGTWTKISLDNHGSYVDNLVQHFGELGWISQPSSAAIQFGLMKLRICCPLGHNHFLRRKMRLVGAVCFNVHVRICAGEVSIAELARSSFCLS